MSANRLNAAEKDLEKFIKFLALKSTQVVVQSRLDHPDVYAETTRALNLVQGESILQRLVGISLKTVEEDQMILEVWSLDVQWPGLVVRAGQQKDTSDKTDAKSNGMEQKSSVPQTISASPEHTLKAAHAIYSRMDILLKSLRITSRSCRCGMMRMR